MTGTRVRDMEVMGQSQPLSRQGRDTDPIGRSMSRTLTRTLLPARGRMMP